jgi:hypothetical protein
MSRLSAVIFLSIFISLSIIGCTNQPTGIDGPKILSDAEKAEAIAIAFQASQIASLIEKGAPYTVRLGWSAIVWNTQGELSEAWSMGEDFQNELQNYDIISESARWYPEVIISTGEDIITQAQISVDLKTKKVVAIQGPYPSLSSPGRFTNTPTP